MDTAVPPTLLDRALKRIKGAWREVAGGTPTDPDLAAEMRLALSAKGGDVSARQRAESLRTAYLAADAKGREAFLATLATFDADPGTVEAAIADLGASTDDVTRIAAKAKLRRALEPPRLKLLRQFNILADGVKFLVDVNATLVPLGRRDPRLGALAADLHHLLSSWFDVGFLELRRIDWSSPAALLEKLVQYEAVHEIRSWRDLKNRLDSDRRCYAFFHPRMPDEPLIFVEVALVKGLASSVQALLDPKAPVLDWKQADTAIFYSISNCQKGLAGISFGNLLIKRVVALLSAEFSNLKTFSTLSPIPGFRPWLERTIDADGLALLSNDEAASLGAALADLEETEDDQPAIEGSVALKRLLAWQGWRREAEASAAMEPVLTRLCARYLVVEGEKRALDPVAHFHLSNGARVERLNWLGDVSEKGMRESAGLMVNYLYDPARIEENHEAYAAEGKRAASSPLRRLSRGGS